ncbi:aminopeptidase N [Plasmodium yoelii 17X]|uniref:M1-family alanyl aminopeptidase n=4 Tax=Plasmodium yoelii TaxID=5861 RepID=A0AAE9X308_PLAYO|nr:M1-family alanyl aminopeptidase, putative [Plasmodium yoelii]EAA20901.1 m1-family aminopeptidase [Plasmodium yoelii yoelii]ETB61354.1 aminopeptidase N [Plasmodium yoelii 17X]WBY60677.1 M1-family alanyl aminopeptidase [Plasmodium yoelii yoelii]CDU20474.1 M1-family alanyl aminopeptidase, putative [Plasmodium yoelii]VTZ81434.1 M1-family alanyl aminopeptidase, putative [Plasmodium yoelii]|eukprot:XP_729336.1 M1-family alanyl aminopeptidase, putative [Plasmodium yoelii]
MVTKKLLSFNLFLIIILTFENLTFDKKNTCMINNTIRPNSCGIVNRVLREKPYHYSSKISKSIPFIQNFSLEKNFTGESLQKNILNNINKLGGAHLFHISKSHLAAKAGNKNTEFIGEATELFKGFKRNFGINMTENKQTNIGRMLCEDDNNNGGEVTSTEKTIFKNSKDPQIHYRTDYKPSGFTIDNVTLNINIFDNETIVRSSLNMCTNENYADEDLVFDGVGLSIKEISINNNKLNEGEDYTYDNEFLTIFAKNVPKENFVFLSEVVIHPETNYALTGLYKSKDIIVSQCEATGFRRITFFIDRPDMMAKYDVTLTADKTKYPVLLSNGDKLNEFDIPGGRHGARFNDPHLKPCYLFAVVAGDLKHLSDNYVTKYTKKPVELYVYSEAKYVSKLKWALECLKKAMKFDEDYFGLEYDLSRLNLVAVSDFNVGAMENKGLNIFNADSLLASKKTSIDFSFERILTVVGHEYFHNYTGNRVTLRDWFQLTLKEGLTVHRENLFSEETTKTATFRLTHIDLLRSVQFLEDSSPLSHPIRPESYISMENFYTNTVYDKGSEVMRMYQTILGDEYYKKGIDIYLKKHDGGTATCEDFNDAMNEAYQMKNGNTDENLDQYLLWFSQSGTPHVTAEYIYDENEKTFTINLSQITYPDDNQKEKYPLFIPVKVGFISPKDGKDVIPEVVLELKKDKESFVFQNVSEKPIPSLFREFSAPVYIKDNLTDEERIALLKYDSDAFVRYNVCIDLYMKQIIKNYNELVSQKTKENDLVELSLTPVNDEFINAIKHLLEDKHADPGFKAYIIALPRDRYIMNYIKEVDPIVLADTKDYIYKQIGSRLNPILFSIFQNTESKANDMTHFKDESYIDFDQLNMRKLRNSILVMLSKAQYPHMLKYIKEQSKSAYPSNWLASLSASAYFSGDDYYDLYDKTYKLSKNDELLLQEWLKTVSRSDRSDIYSIIKKLEVEILKDSKNPNNIRAVYLPFTANLRAFNDISGKGYKLMADVIMKVDKFNPMVATQLCDPFKLWNKLDLKRQALMHDEMNRMLSMENISPNLKEYLLRLTNKM